MKIISRTPHDQIKREICMQKTCAKHDLCKPVEDWWLIQNGGVIITPILKETLRSRMVQVEPQVIKEYIRLNGEIIPNQKTMEELSYLIRSVLFELIKLGWRKILELHQIGIIHGDASQDNMMFDEQDSYILLTCHMV